MPDKNTVPQPPSARQSGQPASPRAQAPDQEKPAQPPPQAGAVDIFSEAEPPASGPAPGAKEERAPAGAPAPTVQQTILTPKEQDELFKREKLSTLQKLILIIIAGLVIAGLVGGGVWLYLTLTKKSGVSEPAEIIEEAAVEEEAAVPAANANAPAAAKDTDKDGLTDEQEKKYGTDINNPDSDNDGYTDGEEVKNGFDPMGPGKLK